MKFSISVIEPEGYQYSHFLYDICKYLCYGIESAGYECCILRNKLAKDRINIVLGAHNQTDPSVVNRIQQAGKYILLQSEIITGDSINKWAVQKSFAEVYLPLMRGALAVWDGVESNIDRLKRHGISAELLRIGYHERMEEIIHKKNRDIDFLFCGSITPHRKIMLDQLSTSGAQVVTMFDDAAMYRNDLIARTRVNLAPNQGPGMNHLGGGRVLYLVNNRSVVVVERCTDQSMYEHCFPWAETEQWVDLCTETLHRPDLEQITEEYYERFKKIRMVDFIAPLIENFLSKYQTGAPAKTFIPSAVDVSESVSPIREDLSYRFQHATAEQDLTSIIIIPGNRLDQTKKCLKSVAKHTPEPHEIIFVDEGSGDDTVKWLKRQVRENRNWRLIENKEDPGFAKAVNRGMTACRGEYMLILDSRVVVSAGWLSGLLACLKRDAHAGVVGPMTNRAEGMQQIADETYRTVDYLDKYAADFREKYRHRRIACRNLDGFCLLFRRALVDEIGFFDERLNAPQVEVEDFCLRAAIAGFCNGIAGDVFVHHGRQESPATRGAASGRKELEQKWVLSSQSHEGRQLAVMKATELADDWYQKGNLDQAIEALVDCIKITPESWEIYDALIRIFMESKRFAEAWEVFLTAPETWRNTLGGIERAGYIKEGLGLDDEAGEYVRRMRALDVSYAPAVNLQGVLAYKRGEKDAAAECFIHAAGSDPGYGEAQTNQGVLLWSKDQQAEAWEHLRRGFVLSPLVPDTGTLYYSAVSALGRFAEAESDYRDAVALYPRNRNLAFLYIDILIQQGKREAAMRRIEDALAAFGVDDGTLKAALGVREGIGPRRIEKKPGAGSLSLCMIVKNEEKHLVKCLSSVRDIVDEIIIVDTGSTDRTMDIARVFGAHVFEFPWTGDFSEARNHSLAQATGDWILVLDADEVLSPLDFPKLKRLIRSSLLTPVAYTVLTRNYVNNVSFIGWTENNGDYPEEAGRGWVPSGKVRLIPKRSDVFFSDPVHETLESSLQRTKIKVQPCDVVVHHYGKLDKDHDDQKGIDYYLLGKLKHEKDPFNMKHILELAKQAHTLKRYEESIDLWRTLLTLIEAEPESSGYKELASISGANPEAETLIQLASSYLLLNRFEEALEAARKAMKFEMPLKEYVNIYAHCEIVCGSIERARHVLEASLQKTPDYPPALLLLAAACGIQGQADETKRIFAKLAGESYQISHGLNMLVSQLKMQGRADEADAIFKAMKANGLVDEETLSLRDAPPQTEAARQGF